MTKDRQQLLKLRNRMVDMTCQLGTNTNVKLFTGLYCLLSTKRSCNQSGGTCYLGRKHETLGLGVLC